MMNRIVAVVSLTLVVAGSALASSTPAQKCEAAASGGLTACIQKVGMLVRKCYVDTGAGCGPTHPRMVSALAGLQKKVLKNCPDATAVQAASFGAVATPAALVAR